jgi:hypothetical protein
MGMCHGIKGKAGQTQGDVLYTQKGVRGGLICDDSSGPGINRSLCHKVEVGFAN